MSVVSQHRAGEDVKKPAPQDTQTRSRLLIGQNGPSDSTLTASSGWRLLAAQPLTGTLRVQTPLRPLHVIVAALEHVHPSRLHSGGSRRSHQGLRATLQGRAGGTELRVACLVPVLC